MQKRSFSDLQKNSSVRADVCLSVAGGDDAHVIEAVCAALDSGLVSRAIITGDAASIEARLPATDLNISLIDTKNATDSAMHAVKLVRAGEADILMKGNVDSSTYLRAIVDRETGIRTGGLLSNVTVAEMPSYHKFIVATDNGIVGLPTLQQKRQIVSNTLPLFRGLELISVKVAVLAATEKLLEGNPVTADAAVLASESKMGAMSGFVVDGPFGYDVAISKAAAKSKNLTASKVAGDADLLLFPSIEAANAVAKSWKYHGQAKTGSIVLGARVPVLLNSRSDSAERRVCSLLLALAILDGEKNVV